MMRENIPNDMEHRAVSLYNYNLHRW